MKVFTTLGTAVLILALGTVVPAFAQNEQEGAKPEEKQQQEHAQPQQHAEPQQQQHAQQQNQANKEHEQQQAKQQSQNKQQQQQQAKQQNQNKQQQHSQLAQQHNSQQPAHHTEEQQHAQQAAWQDHRSQNWQSDHRTWQQRGGYTGYRIPDNRYNGYFGPNHGFVIYSQPYMVVGGFPRFQYDGFWFSLVDPWPNSWSNNWYETDSVYVVYQNSGYYMYNQRYPGIGIAISVSM
ncbi:MAG: hypothetical protein WAM71_18685 [Candidatus Korobacteraceae bacterium]